MSNTQSATAVRARELETLPNDSEDDGSATRARRFTRPIDALVEQARRRDNFLPNATKEPSPVTHGETRGAVPAVVVLQEWEGYVQLVRTHNFEATLIDIRHADRTETKVAKIPLTELSEADRERVKEGAVFRWQICIEKGPTQRRMSQIFFRHLPAWTAKDIAHARNEARTLAGHLRSLAERSREGAGTQSD